MITVRVGGVECSAADVAGCLQLLEPEAKSHTTFAAIQNQLGTGKNPLAGADFWQVVGEWRASHPGTGLTTKVVLITALKELLETGQPGTGGLAELAGQFRAEKGYPDGGRPQPDEERAGLAPMLSAAALGNPDARLLRRLAGRAYGYPGAQPGYYALLKTDAGTAAVAGAFRYLLYGPGDVADRLDDCIRGEHKLSGVGEAVMVKALAVADPARWFPNHVTTGKVGKLAVLAVLGEKLPADLGPGAAAVAGNDRIRQLLDPYFPGDPWGIQEFTWWLVHREPVRGAVGEPSLSPAGDAADTDWTGVEVAAAVGDYLVMLAAEAAGQRYSTAAHRRALRQLLHASRTNAAIVYKHRNISLVMTALGLPYIRGYEPAGSFREELSAEIQRQLHADPALLSQLQSGPAGTVPASPLQRTDPPQPPAGNQQRASAGGHPGRHPDYGLLQEENTRRGAAGEQLVVDYERAWLREHGCSDLADRVRWAAHDDGDGLGYDVLSYSTDGSKRYIEVKTTALGDQTPFYLSSAELQFACQHLAFYTLYRVYDLLTGTPRFFALDGNDTLQLDLTPVTYRASLPGGRQNDRLTPR